MLNLRRRLKNLEAQLTDGSGLRPHSAGWLDYWAQRVSKILTGEAPGDPGCIPLEVWDAVGAADGSERNPQGADAQDLAHVATVALPSGDAGIATDNA